MDHMVPQLLLPVAATTIGVPTQKALWWDRSSAAEACRLAIVFTFYFVLLALCVPQTHTTHTSCQTPGLPAEGTWKCAIYVLVDGDRSGEQEKQMSTSELEHGGGGVGGRGGEGEQAGSQLVQEQTMLFFQRTLWPGRPRGVAI